MHHPHTNIIGKDRDIGYGMLRMSEDQAWRPYYLGNPLYAALLACLFQYGVALHDLETERIAAGEASLGENRGIPAHLSRTARPPTPRAPPATGHAHIRRGGRELRRAYGDRERPG